MFPRFSGVGLLDELPGDVVPRKGRCEAIVVIASEGLSVQLATRLRGVSGSGCYQWRGRAR